MAHLSITPALRGRLFKVQISHARELLLALLKFLQLVIVFLGPLLELLHGTVVTVVILDLGLEGLHLRHLLLMHLSGLMRLVDDVLDRSWRGLSVDSVRYDVSVKGLEV